MKDRNTKEKAADEAEKILYECLENGLSFKISQGNVLTLAPPLIITEEELEYAMDIVEKAIKNILVSMKDKSQVKLSDKTNNSEQDKDTV